MKFVARRPITRASNKLKRAPQNKGFSGVVTIDDDDDDEVLDSVMTALEKNSERVHTVSTDVHICGKQREVDGIPEGEDGLGDNCDVRNDNIGGLGEGGVEGLGDNLEVENHNIGGLSEGGLGGLGDNLESGNHNGGLCEGGVEGEERLGEGGVAGEYDLGKGGLEDVQGEDDVHGEDEYLEDSDIGYIDEDGDTDNQDDDEDGMDEPENVNEAEVGDTNSEDSDFMATTVSDNEECLLYESDSDDVVKKSSNRNPKYNPNVNGGQFVFQLGMEFPTMAEFKNAIRTYAVEGGYQIHFDRNEKHRCQAKCEVGCPWRIWCSKISGESTYQIKTYVRRHKCNRSQFNKQASSSWLAQKLVDKIRAEPKVSAGNLVTYTKENLSLRISRTHAYRSKVKALEIIEGKHKEQYEKLRSYMTELMRTNRGSTCNLVVDRDCPEEPAVFKRAYICLAPLKNGFLAGCRPLIGRILREVFVKHA